jgi:hypothetical protein
MAAARSRANASTYGMSVSQTNPAAFLRVCAITSSKAAAMRVRISATPKAYSGSHEMT